MCKRIIIIGYNKFSASVKLLADALKTAQKKPVIRVAKDSIKYQPRRSDYIINWGCSKPWEFITHDNKNGHSIASNKLDFFKKISKWNSDNQQYPNTFVNIPEWTEDENIASQWKSLVVCRKLLSGHSGAGIVLHENGGDTQLPKAPLYVAYKKKKHEYRAHVFRQADGTYQVIDIAQKKKKAGIEHNTKIRNHANGWVYAREDIVEPEDLKEQAIRAITAVGLKFGAVDLIWNEKENKSYILEINTAPGITGTTLERYTQAFIKDITNEV